MKLILNTNPVILLDEFQKSVRDGNFFVPGRSDLFIHPSGLLELDLYEQELVIEKINYEDALDRVVIQTHDKIFLLLEVQRYVISGWQIDLKSIYFDSIGTKRCKLINTEHPAAFVYDKETLDAMDYEELKRVSKIRKCFNRSRSVMVEQILRFQQEG